jgi:site-specific DNA-methyltransferase (adenine-specific)
VSWRPEIAARLFNEDCIEGMRRLPERSVDMVLADPPYGTTANPWDTPLPLPDMWAGLKRVCRPDAAILMFAQCPFNSVLGVSNIRQLKYEWIWVKSRMTGFLNVGKMPLKATENVMVFYDKLPKFNSQYFKGKSWNRGNVKEKSYYSPVMGRDYKVFPNSSDGEKRHPFNILYFPNENKPDPYHPTLKPVPLCEYLIKTYTDPGDTVLDITAGSGTTAVAAVNLDRDWLAFETDPGYCATAARRIDDAMTAKERSLFHTGFPPSVMEAS